jgi:hypothetical protein
VGLRPVIPATREVEIKRITAKASPGIKRDPISKITKI